MLFKPGFGSPMHSERGTVLLEETITAEEESEMSAVSLSPAREDCGRPNGPSVLL